MVVVVGRAFLSVLIGIDLTVLEAVAFLVVVFLIVVVVVVIFLVVVVVFLAVVVFSGLISGPL